MSSSTTRKSDPPGPPIPSTNWAYQLVLSPWLWAPLVTLGFYLSIPHLPLHRESMTRFFCSHWILYAETGLGFLGLAILLRRAVDFIQENRALKLVVIDAASLESIPSPAERAQSLLSATTNVPAGIRETKLVTRIRETCEYVARRGMGSAVEDHLRYLADLAADHLKSSFAPVRTILWTAPILGILGTILRTAVAFHSIDPDNLDASMPVVLAGLGGTLDGTVLALAVCVVLLLGKTIVERCESQVLAHIERFGISHLAPCLAHEPAADTTDPLAKAETEAAVHLLERTESLVNWQTGLWQEALEDLRRRWLDSAAAQQSQFAAALEQGMGSSLASHSQQLEEARGEFLKAFRAVGLELTRVTAGLQQMGQEHHEIFQKEVAQTWQAMQTQMAAARGEHHDQLAGSVALFQTAVRGWHDDLSKAATAMTAQLQELRRHGELLQNVAGQEEELVRLQTTLTHNLQSVRAMEAFEQSIHSLNAAVHLLTMRTKAHAA